MLGCRPEQWGEFLPDGRWVSAIGTNGRYRYTITRITPAPAGSHAMPANTIEHQAGGFPTMEAALAAAREYAQTERDGAIASQAWRQVHGHIEDFAPARAYDEQFGGWINTSPDVWESGV
jgi:hypothetical protein